ncbi:DarT ssDNA thymidine ADP-ribosyltransferase family protein [Neomoorella thermoacetica]|uniref:DarT ssDNA thymidine ADP-ribosyltransferase family protein n=1 Tax=Neomoorella thermoacetica TaxID=1525 RepID=UPI0030CDAF11
MAWRRGITRLCHLTQSRKLVHILSSSEGILSQAQLTITNPGLLDPNDQARLDGYVDYVSCSIEYPNTWYFRAVKERDKLFTEWVALLLSPELLWSSGTLFCQFNAATCRGALVRGGFDAFASLFASEVSGLRGVRRRTPKMLPCCPTDDQAEVLIPRNVPRDMILAVAVPSAEQARIEMKRLAYIGDVPSVKWIVAADLFTTRLSVLVRNGVRPEETPYIEEGA